MSQSILIDKLRLLIKGRSIIKFWYEDESGSRLHDWRIVHPYLIGVHSTTGNVLLSGWFVPTQAQKMSGLKEDWGLYKLSGIDLQKLVVTNETYTYTAKGYKGRNDTRMSDIIWATPVNQNPTDC